MLWKQIVQALGVDSYPACFEEIYLQLSDDHRPACDPEIISKAEQEYAVFGKYYDTVKETAIEVNQDAASSAWVRVVTAFLSDEKWGSYKEIPIPPFNGTAKQDLLMLFPLVAFIPSAVARYRKWGFDREQIADYMQTFWRCIQNVEKRTGYPGLDLTYFHWLHRFAMAEMLKAHGIQFELTRLKSCAIYLRDKETGAVIPIMTEGLFHKSGKQRLGSGGFAESQGAFEATFTENTDRFCGHGVWNAVVSKEIQEFSKDRWECVARPGDRCLGMHIPRGADISRENIQRAYETVCKILGEGSLPVQCVSWVLDPGLETILDEDSKLVCFGKLFSRYPGKNPGRAANSFVFPGKYGSEEDLPEETRLQRGLKQHYLAGGYSYNYTGLLVF
jgi:hypothetical protein